MNWINVHPGKVPWNSSLDNCPPLMTVATSTMSSDPKNIYRKHLIPLLLFLQWDEKVRVKLRRLRQNLLLHYTGSDRTLSLLCIWLIGVTFGYAVSFPCSLHKALCNGGCDTQKVLVNGREAPRSSERAGYSANVTSRVGQHQACLETNWGTAHVKRGEKADGPTWEGGGRLATKWFTLIQPELSHMLGRSTNLCAIFTCVENMRLWHKRHAIFKISTHASQFQREIVPRLLNVSSNKQAHRTNSVCKVPPYYYHDTLSHIAYPESTFTCHCFPKHEKLNW